MDSSMYCDFLDERLSHLSLGSNPLLPEHDAMLMSMLAQYTIHNSYDGHDVQITHAHTCDPSNAMEPQVDYSDFLQGEWLDAIAPTTDYPKMPFALEPVPAQLMTPPTSVAAPVLPIPSTPKRPLVKATTHSFSNTGMLSPPLSNQPVRTRRFNAFDGINQLSNLMPNMSLSEKSTTKSSPVSATSFLPTWRATETPATAVVRLETEMHYPYPPSSSSSSSASSATLSPIDSPSSTMSDSFGSPLSPPESPVRSARRSGVDRLRVSHRGSGEKSYFHPYGNPTPSGERERPHGCRHPGDIPGDVPCDKNFKRMHDWVRHQRVHTGETPYKCLSCGKEFKRSDARCRHWDSKSGCEAYHTNLIRERFLQDQITAEHPDIRVLRHRAHMTVLRKESKRTGIPVRELKATMPREDIVGPGF